MTILCIETSTSVCSAAVCENGSLIRQCISLEGSNHARLLPRYIEELLSFAREQALSIDAVALSEGPGSYTGLRIGTSTAKGICYGLNIPLIPVPTLEVLCEAARQRLEVSGERIEDAILVPMIDARRMEVYTAVYDGKEANGERRMAKAVVVENEDSLMSEGKHVYYFGDGAEKCSKVFTKPNWHYVPGIVPEARFLAMTVGSPSVDRREKVNLAYYEPYYLKEFVAAQSHVKGLA